MPMSPELELVDQLEGGLLPLEVVIGLFSDRVQAMNALWIYVSKGIVRISRSGGLNTPLREWQVRELCRRTPDQGRGDDNSLVVELTSEGAKLWSTGGWDQM
jgi:hypothetical protein